MCRSENNNHFRQSPVEFKFLFLLCKVENTFLTVSYVPVEIGWYLWVCELPRCKIRVLSTSFGVEQVRSHFF